MADLFGEVAPATDGYQLGDNDVHHRPPVQPTGWRWWLDDAGRRNAVFYVSRWLACEGAGDCARLFGLRMRYGCAAILSFSG